MAEVIVKEERLTNLRKAAGVELPMDGSPFRLVYDTIKKYKANILLYFLTGIKERPLSRFGNNLRELFFGQGNLTEGDKASIAATIEQDLSFYLPKIAVNDVSIEEYNDHSIQITVNFSVIGTDLQDSVTIDLEE